MNTNRNRLTNFVGDLNMWDKKCSHVDVKWRFSAVLKIAYLFHVNLYLPIIDLRGWFSHNTLHKEWSFPLRISSVNATNLILFTEEFRNRKLHFLCSDMVRTSSFIFIYLSKLILCWCFCCFTASISCIILGIIC